MKKMKKDYLNITYINVPYAQKDFAKKLGARWDSGKKSWYVPSHLSLVEFIQWLPAHLKKPHNPVIDKFSDTFRASIKKKVDEHFTFLLFCEMDYDPMFGECYIDGGLSPFWKYKNLL